MGRDTFEIIEGQQQHFGYAQAVRVGDTIWIANTPGCDESLTFPDDMTGQLHQVYVNLATTLEHFSCGFRDLVDLMAPARLRGVAGADDGGAFDADQHVG